MSSLLAVLIVLLKLLAWAFAALALFAILAMSLPVKAKVRGSASAERLLEGLLDDDGPDEISLDVDFDIEASLFGGALGFSMSGDDSARVSILGLAFHPGKTKRSSAKISSPAAASKPSSMPGKAEQEHVSPRRRKRGTLSAGHVRRFLAPQVRVRTVKVIRDLLGAIHATGYVDLGFGLEEPGTTAMVVAAYWALGGTARFRGLTLRPSFSGESFDITVSVESRTVPVEIVWIAARYLLSREIRPLWRKRRADSGGADTHRPIRTLSA